MPPTGSYPTATPYGNPPPKATAAAPAGGVYIAGSSLGSDRKFTKRSVASLIFRLMQLIFSVIGLAIMASAHDKRDALTGHSLDYTDYKGYMWLMVMLVLVFVWSLITLILDALEACTSFSMGGIVALIIAVVDLFLAFLVFGAACSAATLDTDVVGGGSGKFSSRVRAATAFGFVTWLFLVPTMLLNTAIVITEVFG